MIKRIIGYGGALIVFALWVGPFATAIADVLCWFWLGSQCTSVDYNGDTGTRGPFIVAWTALAFYPAICIIAALCELAEE